MEEDHSLTSRAPRRSWSLLIWAVGIVVAVAIGARPHATRVVEDEIYWIGSAYYFHLAFQARDFSHPDWRLLPARENPPAAKYLIGAAIAAGGGRVETPDLLGSFYLFFARIPGAWGTPADQAKRGAVTARMSPEAMRSFTQQERISFPAEWVHSARYAMIACVVGASLLLFLMARGLLGDFPSLAVSLLLPLHPIAADSMNHAMADAPALLLSAAAMASLSACLGLLARANAPASRLTLVAVATGTLTGLACATKMNSLVLCLLAAAGFALVAAIPSPGSARTRIRLMLIPALLIASSAGVVFLVINPALYGDCWAGLLATVEEHRRTGVIQASFLTGHLVTFTDRLGALAEIIGFHRWTWVPLLGCAAFLTMVGQARHRLPAIWWLVSWLAVNVWIPASRLRYAAPVLIPTLLLVAASLHWALVYRASHLRLSPARKDHP